MTRRQTLILAIFGILDLLVVCGLGFTVYRTMNQTYTAPPVDN